VTVGEIAGYVASVLVFATFYMKTMMPLRIAGILSNIAFITYASIEGLLPILVLHSALLPLNLVRLNQLRAQLREIGAAAAGDFSIKPLLPLMKPHRMRAGDVIFRADDPADKLYFLATGAISLPEVGADLQPGTLFGEFGLFSPSGRRTATAIAKTDGTILSLDQSDIIGTLLQHPKLGILLLRLITARFLENVGEGESPDIVRDVDKVTDPATTPAARAASETRSNLRLWATVLIVGVTVTSLGVIFGPSFYFYLERESAVTTWLDVAASPIQGTIVSSPPQAGSIIDETGLVAEVTNVYADTSDRLRAQAILENAQAELARLQAYQGRMHALDLEWQQRTEDYATGFQDNLDIVIKGLGQEIDLLRQRVDLAQAAMDRQIALTTTGAVSQSTREIALRDLLDLQELLVAREKQLAGAQLRRRLADQGVFIESDGRSPDWAYSSRDSIRLQMEDVSAQIIDAQADIEKASKDLEAEETGLSATTTALVKAPPGSTVWVRLANQGEVVNVGSPIVEWVDCGTLLVDVPASNVLAGLLGEGMAAQILIEGESNVHDGAVLFTRGPGAKLTDRELAASASGHDANTAQVIVKFLHEKERKACPVGRAASVTFPQVSLFTLVKALFRMN